MWLQNRKEPQRDRHGHDKLQSLLGEVLSPQFCILCTFKRETMWKPMPFVESHDMFCENSFDRHQWILGSKRLEPWRREKRLKRH